MPEFKQDDLVIDLNDSWQFRRPVYKILRRHNGQVKCRLVGNQSNGSGPVVYLPWNEQQVSMRRVSNLETFKE